MCLLLVLFFGVRGVYPSDVHSRCLVSCFICEYMSSSSQLYLFNASPFLLGVRGAHPSALRRAHPIFTVHPCCLIYWCTRSSFQRCALNVNPF